MHWIVAVAEPIVAQLDPLRCSEHCLYKDSTTRKNGALVKVTCSSYRYRAGLFCSPAICDAVQDLSRLNRDLKDVIVIDDDKACLQLQVRPCLGAACAVVAA